MPSGTDGFAASRSFSACTACCAAVTWLCAVRCAAVSAREKALGGQPFLRRFRRSHRLLRLGDGGIGSLGSSLFLGKRGFGLRQLFFNRHARTRSWQQ